MELEVSLDPTLGCGQAHRWRKAGEWWEGVIGNDVVRLRQTPYGAEVEGCSDKDRLLSYFRSQDDLSSIIADISERDPYVASLSENCPGLRILGQDRWECMATYLLATNVNVTRIGKMVESVCDTFGKDLGGRHAFPTAKEILDRQEHVKECRLGFREPRFIELAQRVEDGDVDVDAIAELDYEGCTSELMKIKGIGPKVADCVAIFGYGHLEAFPVDVRISQVMERMYGVTGSYKTVSRYGMEKFGRYAGYAQEFLYHSKFIMQDRGHPCTSEDPVRSVICRSLLGARCSSRYHRVYTSRFRNRHHPY